MSTCRAHWVEQALLFRGIYQISPQFGGDVREGVRRSFHEGQHRVEFKVVDETGDFDTCSLYVTVAGAHPFYPDILKQVLEYF